MASPPSPLVGYNTNVRHKGKLYHIQTEDSGVKNPVIVTQLFTDGGRILAMEKTSYEEHVEQGNLGETIKKLMQDQHKRVFIALRDGIYDEDGSEGQAETATVDTEVLEHAAAKLVEGSPSYESRFVALKEARAQQMSNAPDAPFGRDFVSEKSLDEVILAYLTRDLKKK